MIKSWKQFVQYWYVFCIIVMIASLPFSKILLSIGQFMMAGGWIAARFDEMAWWKRTRQRSWWSFIPVAVPDLFYSLGKAIADGFRQFLGNRAAAIFSSIILLHVAGLLFTYDMDYAFKDIRTKLPVLLLPLFLSTSSRFSEKNFFRFMLLFIAALLIRTLYNTWLIAGHHYVDIREVSRNVSHIILSLEITLALFILGYFIVKRGLFNAWQRAALSLVMIWFIIYILMSRSFTGLAITVLTVIVLVPFMIVRIRMFRIKVLLLAVIVILTGMTFWSIRSVVKEYYQVTVVDFHKLEPNTRLGNPYIHNIHARETENGHYLWIYIQWDEMREAWNRRSSIPFDSLNLKGETNAYTVVRFLTSKGWRKDADAVDRLTKEEVAAIEKGVANYIFLKQFSVRGRIYEFLWGYENYRQTGNPTGSSVMQRLEFWKASAGIIKENWLTGVGTGDMNTAFSEQYEKMQTKLDPSQRWRSHNQYLSILIGMGIFGLLWFLLAILVPPVIMHKTGDYFLIVFLLIIGLSMLTEDTIETQMGVTFFAFFYSFFLFAREGATRDNSKL